MAKKIYVGNSMVSATNLLGGQGEVSITGNTKAVETTQNLSISPSLVQNHIYYFGVDIYQDDLTAGAEFYWPIAEPKVMSETRASAINTWTRIGGVNSRTAWSSGIYACRIDNNNHNTSATIKYKNFILIDLTATFGSGSEPDVTWCNENIGYFSGTGVVPDATGTVSPTARKVKKIYVGVNDVARKVKKGYIGVSGVARCFFSGGELSRYGTIKMSNTRYDVNVASVGNYVLGAGGSVGGSTNSNLVEAYNTSLSRSTPTELNAFVFGKDYIGAISIGNYALFAGGMYSNSQVNTADAYDSSLTKVSSVTSLSTARYHMGTACAGNYALFAGGRNSSANFYSTVDAYNTSLTRSTATSLSSSTMRLTGSSVGNYAIFSGGYYFGNVVQTYNQSLTRGTASTLATPRWKSGSTTIGNYALICGGCLNSGDTATNAAETYNTSLTRSTQSSLGVARCEMASTTVGEYALFCGGSTVGSSGMSYHSNYTDAYNTSLVREVPAALSNKISYIYNAGGTVGNYALIWGGITSTGNYSDNVEVYTVS